MVNITLKANLKTPFLRVVQKANIGKKYTYALQIYKNDTYVSRTQNAVYNGQTITLGTPGLKFPGRSTHDIEYGLNKAAAGGHTQTWEYAGTTGHGNWFIGTKPNDGKWATQIARVSYPGSHTKNTEMTRISNLVEMANKDNWHGQHLLRAEAAVSPNYEYLLISTVWENHSGHFGLYSLPKVNAKLDKIGSGNIKISDLAECKAQDNYIVDIDNIDSVSLQGFDIDNDKNIYISSQYSPDIDGKSKPRSIYKVFWDRPEVYNWQQFDLSNYRILETNFEGKPTEFEGIQVIGKDHLYLTVAYHQVVNNTVSTVGNQIFEIQL
ncbi:hypothetical protein J2Z60_001516 [Lactobacillus colini]|uniref:Bacteriocin helveticin-J n=1 Tax=Lactobacillus colini TaxID=1819254 RepID=A0ABS4MG49_9LACO|nr:helveticin J family class III bacteriocin [Lactobacillus colini]MBP2058337.1 hypothetical protein [Lactobacillus colini]